MGCIRSGPAFSVASVRRWDRLDVPTHVFNQKDRLPADLVAEILDEQFTPIHNPRIHQRDFIIESVFAVFESDFLTRGIKLRGPRL